MIDVMFTPELLEWLPLLFGIQIGPRIRVGGTAGKIGQAIKNNVPGVGAMLGHSMAPGGGAIIGSLAEGGTKQLGRDLRIGARNAAMILPMAGAANAAAAGGAAAGGGMMSRAKQIMGAAGDIVGGGEGEGLSFWDKLLMGGTVAAGAEDAMRRRGFEDDARRYARTSYDNRAPLRTRAMQLLERDQRPDHSALFRDPGNVYDTQRRQMAPPPGGA